MGTNTGDQEKQANKKRVCLGLVSVRLTGTANPGQCLLTPSLPAWRLQRPPPSFSSCRLLLSSLVHPVRIRPACPTRELCLSSADPPRLELGAPATQASHLILRGLFRARDALLPASLWGFFFLLLGSAAPSPQMSERSLFPPDGSAARQVAVMRRRPLLLRMIAATLSPNPLGGRCAISGPAHGPPVSAERGRRQRPPLLTRVPAAGRRH